MDQGIIMEDVYMALMKYDVDKTKFIYTDDNAKQLVEGLAWISLEPRL